MRHWTLLGEAPIPGSDRSLSLYQLGALPCQRLRNRESARVLIGGLGMGFTLAAVLGEVGPGAEVTVAELIPEVVDWNRGPLGELSGFPLNDPRTSVYVGDVAKLLRSNPGCYDVIALDVDNGPEGLTQSSNDWLYSTPGIVAAQTALAPNGILAYWSAGQDQAFHDRLRRCGFNIEEATVFAHGKKGARHTIWLVSLS
jgi:spermidine synthase